MTTVTGVARLQREHRRLQQAANASVQCLTASFQVPDPNHTCYHDPPYDQTNCQTGNRMDQCRWETAKMRDMKSSQDGLKGKCVTAKGSSTACGCWREHLGACANGSPNPVTQAGCEAQQCFWDENYTQPNPAAALSCRQLGPCIEGQEGAQFNKYCWKRYGDGPADNCAAMQACPNGAPADHNCHKARTDLESWFTKEKFDDLFFKANLGFGPNDCSPVNYEAFMIAARYFPSFGNEHYDSDPMGLQFDGDYQYSAEDTYKRDLAAFFAHGIQETGENDSNLFASSRTNADADIDGNNFENWSDEDAANCFFRGGNSVWFHGTHINTIWEDAFAPEGGVHDPAKGGECANEGDHPFWSGSDAQEACYAGRGPLQLTGSANNYGPFNDWLRKQGIKGPDGKLIDILAQPNLVVTMKSPPLYFMSSMWYYMTPQNPKWAMHDVVIGNWVATKANQDAGFYGPIFGPTNLIINNETQAENDAQPLEAGQASRRIKAFRWFSEHFGVTITEPKKTLSAAEMPDKNAVHQMPNPAHGEFCRAKVAGAACSHADEAACITDVSCQWISMMLSWDVRGNEHKPRDCIGWDNATNSPKPTNDAVCGKSRNEGGFGSTGPNDAWWGTMNYCNNASINGDANNGCRWTMEYEENYDYKRIWVERPCDCLRTNKGAAGVWTYPSRSEGGYFSDRLADYDQQNKAFCEVSVFKSGEECGFYPHQSEALLADLKLCWLSPSHPQGCVNDGETCLGGTPCTSVREDPTDSQEEGTCKGIAAEQDSHCVKYAFNKYFCREMAVTKDLCTWVKSDGADAQADANTLTENNDQANSADANNAQADADAQACPVACTTKCQDASETDCNNVWNGQCTHAAIGAPFGTEVLVSQYGWCGTGGAYSNNARADCTPCNPNGTAADSASADQAPEGDSADSAVPPQPQADYAQADSGDDSADSPDADAQADDEQGDAGSCPTTCQVKCTGGDIECNNQWNGKCDFNAMSVAQGTRVFVSQWGWCGTSSSHESNARAECTSCNL